MKLPFINEGIFEPHKSPLERGKSLYIYIYIYNMKNYYIFYKFMVSKMKANTMYNLNIF